MKRESWRHDVVHIQSYSNYNSEREWLDTEKGNAAGQEPAYTWDECRTCGWRGVDDMNLPARYSPDPCPNEADDEPQESLGGKSYNQWVREMGV